MVNATPRPLHPRERDHSKWVRVCPRTGLDGCGYEKIS